MQAYYWKPKERVQNLYCCLLLEQTRFRNRRRKIKYERGRLETVSFFNVNIFSMKDHRMRNWIVFQIFFVKKFHIYIHMYGISKPKRKVEANASQKVGIKIIRLGQRVISWRTVEGEFCVWGWQGICWWVDGVHFTLYTPRHRLMVTLQKSATP